MDELRPRLTFRGKDIIDLCLLAAVVGDRSAGSEMDWPAIFFSTNKRVFQPKIETQPKMRQEFYQPYRMVWHDDFDLTPAVLHWQNEFAVKPPS